MKSFKYTINGNVYKVHINSVVDDIAEVEVNGTPYNVKMEKPAKKQMVTLKRPAQAPTTASGEPVVLNERGDWDYKWKDLSNSYLWTVAAAECPKGYSEAVTREDWHQYVITFTYGETEKNNPDTGR